MSWEQLGEMQYAAATVRWAELSNPPIACPNDGTPLIPSPSAATSRLFCPFDGWKYPEDDNRPII